MVFQGGTVVKNQLGNAGDARVASTGNFSRLLQTQPHHASVVASATLVWP